ncbi:S-antigen protein-like [Simochromis diagramma]|uniref:S-antigen protein-like n=1 Tax=Simochromis diagramma TaxID=43689 RepID=UPI001A7EA7C4|nr:S-antigen protein-like [Simochromis diagramma]
MGAVRTILVCLLTVWLAGVSGLSHRQNKVLQREKTGLGANDGSIQRALALLQSILTQNVDEVQQETNEVDTEASVGSLKSELPLKKPNNVKTVKGKTAVSQKVGFSKPSDSNATAGGLLSDSNATAGGLLSDSNATAGGLLSDSNATAGGLLSDSNATAGGLLSDSNATAGGLLSDSNATAGGLLSDSNATAGGLLSDSNATAGGLLSDSNATAGGLLSDSNATAGGLLSDSNARRAACGPAA